MEIIQAAGTGRYSLTQTYAGHSIPEGQWYRGKMFGVLPPKASITQVLTKDATISGTPASTFTITIDSDGKVTVASPATISAFVEKIKVIIDSIDDLAKPYEGLQYAIVTPPAGSLGDGAIQLTQDGSTWLLPYGSVTPASAILGYSVYGVDDTPGPVFAAGPQIASVDIDEVDEYVQQVTCFCDAYEGSVRVELEPKIGQNPLFVIRQEIPDADYHTGALIEKYVTGFLVALGLTGGKFGTLIGAINEYSRNNQFGDLDVPVEVFLKRVEAYAG